MKRLLFIIMLVLFCNNINAQIKTGYHGFVEAGYALNLGSTCGMDWIELNTVHGYQFNPHIFVGGGLGIHYVPEFEEGDISGWPMWRRDASQQIPIFANFKWNILNKKITPFVDLRLGFDATKDTGLYESIGFGCRFGLKNNKAINLKLSYVGRTLKVEELNTYLSPSMTYIKHSYDKENDESQSNISLTVGFEF